VIRYHIVVEGISGSLVEAAIDGMTVHAGGQGRSELEVDVIDQAHLQSVLHRLADLQASIVDVHRIE
jgi:hypothetical protein